MTTHYAFRTEWSKQGKPKILWQLPCRREHRETGGWEANFDSAGAGKHHRGHNWIGTWNISIVLPVMGQWIGISHVGNRRWECTEVAYFHKHENLGNSCMVKWYEIELKK